jgi:hypothetical protein
MALDRATDLLRRGVRPHYVYFMMVETPWMTAVKIGTSYDPEQRINSIRRAGCKCPEGIKYHLNTASLIGQVEGDAELERELHRSFAAARLDGEWFNYSLIQNDVISLLSQFCVCRGCQAVNSAHL